LKQVPIILVASLYKLSSISNPSNLPLPIGITVESASHFKCNITEAKNRFTAPTCRTGVACMFTFCNWQSSENQLKDDLYADFTGNFIFPGRSLGKQATA